MREINNYSTQQLYKLPFTDIDALRNYRDKHGRRWKASLIEVWADGRYFQRAISVDQQNSLQRVRNVIGPSGLYKLHRDF